MNSGSVATCALAYPAQYVLNEPKVDHLWRIALTSVFFQRALVCPQDLEVTLVNHFCTAKVDPEVELAEFREHLNLLDIEDEWEIADGWTEGELLIAIRSAHLLDIRQPARRLFLAVYRREPRNCHGRVSFGFELRVANPTKVQEPFLSWQFLSPFLVR